MTDNQSLRGFLAETEAKFPEEFLRIGEPRRHHRLYAFLFFPIVANVATACATIEPELLEVMRSLGTSQRDMTVKIGIPRSLPYFFASLKIAITLAFVGSVIAEIIAGDNGVGNVMPVAGSNFDVSLVFAALLFVGFMGVGMYAIFDVIERRMTRSARSDISMRQVGGG